ncbi:MAG: glycosyltransferase family 1 protein [Pseudomonadota bacterium]
MLHFFWTPYVFKKGCYERYESANNEIVKYARRHLGQKTSVHVAGFNSGRVTEREKDILLGHPTWDASWRPGDDTWQVQDDWVRDNALSPAAPCHPNTYIMMPWVPIMSPEFHTPFIESQLSAARRIFAICGDIWIQRTRALEGDSIHGAVKDKLVQVNLGCDGRHFPFKTVFGTENRRNFLHISNLAKYKNLPLLCQSLDGIGATLMVASQSLKETGWTQAACIDEYGKKRMYPFYSLGRISNSDPKLNAFLIENFDFYIHTSTFDAQATVILENCLRGLVPLITPESGFSCPYAVYLTQDPIKNREIIRKAIGMPEEEYAERSRGVRAHVLEHHDWGGIYDRIWSVIQADQESGAAPGAVLA